MIVTKSNKVHFIENTTDFEPINTFLSNNSSASIFVIIDENTQKYCLPILQKVLRSNIITLQIASGEINKNLDTCQLLWQKLLDLGADRNTILINLGGGVLTDLGGFVAATYKRGIRFINIPTTLLAMVDAAIGGKTGIDFNQLKNQIGVFANPEMTLIYPTFLKTLAPREIRAGLAEVIKYGLIADTAIWEYIQKMDTNSYDIDPTIIKKSIQIKENIVAKDPTEKGVRKILNFGHTLGHAIETHLLSKPKAEQLLHGEAVAIGMILAAQLSSQTQNFPIEKRNEVTILIKRLYPNISISNKDITAILDLLKYDKKNTNGQVNFVLLQTIGKPVLDCQVSTSQIIEAFDFYKAL